MPDPQSTLGGPDASHGFAQDRRGSDLGFGVFKSPHRTLLGLAMSDTGSTYLQYGGHHSTWEDKKRAAKSIHLSVKWGC